MKNAVKLFQENMVELLSASEARMTHCLKQLNQNQLWWTPGPNQNSVGALVRHIDGNLRQWAIAGIQKAKDHRDRNAEFHSSEQPSAENLLKAIRKTISETINIIQQLDETKLREAREIQRFPTTVMGALLHTVPHSVGHTHQIVQLTRMQLANDYQFHWSPNDPRTSIPL
ncbi:MAG: DUF1572 family protein [Fuerstiella sp.]